MIMNTIVVLIYAVAGWSIVTAGAAMIITTQRSSTGCEAFTAMDIVIRLPFSQLQKIRMNKQAYCKNPQGLYA
jgi:hypothetical protein